MKDLTKNTENPLAHYSDCINLMICKEPEEDCYFGKCKNCPGSQVLYALIVELLEENDMESVTYKHWVSKPRTSLETSIKSSLEFAEEFCAKMTTLLPHSFISKEQACFMKTLKATLEHDEFLIVCDFAENCSFVIQDAAPGFHWNNNQATIYPVVVYYRINDTVSHKSLVIVSDCLTHDSIAVCVYSQIINDFIKTISKHPAKLYYISDGAPQQFKNYKHFANVYYHEEDYGVPAEHHFFATAHGKGPCDGIGGTVKRMVARASLQLAPDRQITTPQELYEWASVNIPNVEVEFVPKEKYDAAKDFLQARFKSTKRVPCTQKLHCIIPRPNNVVRVKNYSRSKRFEEYPIVKRT